MTTKTQEHILQLLLSRSEEQWSIRKIARALEKSYTLTYHNIQALLKEEVLESHSLPPAHMIQIKEDAPANILIETERKRAEAFLEKYGWMRLYLNDILKTAKPFFIMIIFGSYAKGIETKNSDIDILFIVPVKENIASMEHTEQAYTKVKKSIITLDVQNFSEMIKNPKVLNVGNEARKYHIILHGAEQYYHILGCL